MKTKIRKIFLSLFWLSLVIVLINCPNPVPTLSSLTPNTKVYHMPEFTMTATGTDFSSDTVIVFNGIQKTTVFVSSTELNCQIYPQDIAIGGASLQVLVRNTVSGNESNILYFMVEKYHTFPTLVQAGSSLSPCGITASAKIAVDDEKNVNIVWEEGHPPDWEGYVYFIRSEDLGLTWINSQEIPQPCNLGNFYPAIAVDKSLNINIVYAKQTSGDGTYDLYFLRSQEGEGIHWTVPLNVTSGYTTYAKYSDIRICQYNNTENIAVVFNSYMTALIQCDIYFVHSSNSGASWSLPVNVSDTKEQSVRERMAVDSGGEIYVVWLDSGTTINSREIFINHSPDFGVTWGNPRLLSPNDVEFRYPDVEVGEPGCVYAVWVEQKGDDNIYTVLFRHSDDKGTTWTAPVSLAENSSNSMQAVIAADTAGNVNLYYYNSDGCFFRRSADRGRTWEQPIQIPLPPPGSGDITLDDEGNIYLTIVSGNIIYFTYSQQ